MMEESTSENLYDASCGFVSCSRVFLAVAALTKPDYSRPQAPVMASFLGFKIPDEWSEAGNWDRSLGKFRIRPESRTGLELPIR